MSEGITLDDKQVAAIAAAILRQVAVDLRSRDTNIQIDAKSYLHSSSFEQLCAALEMRDYVVRNELIRRSHNGNLADKRPEKYDIVRDWKCAGSPDSSGSDLESPPR